MYSVCSPAAGGTVSCEGDVQMMLHGHAICEGALGMTVNTFTCLKNGKECVSLPKLVCFLLTESSLHTSK